MDRRLRVLVIFMFVLLGVLPALSAERTVDLAASDGTKLKASYFAAAKPGPGVLLLHQCNRQRKVWDGLAQQLAASGINVMTLDNRGFGESGGARYDKATPQERQTETQKWPGDIDAAYEYLVSQPGVDKKMIGVGGASCGVDNSIQTARRHPEVRSLVLLSGNTDLNGRYFLRKSNVPIFFAVADDDEFRPTVMTIQWLYSIDGNPEKKLMHYATGGHGSDMFAVHPELPGLIVDWYVTTLIKTPGHAPVSHDDVATPEQVRVLNLMEEPGGPAKVAQMLQGEHQPDLVPEAIVNVMGYQHMQAGDTKSAIEILKINVIAYPKSPNAYDSLGDAYLADGQKELARQNASKALELLASDTADNEQQKNAIKDSAQGKLKQVGDAQQ